MLICLVRYQLCDDMTEMYKVLLLKYRILTRTEDLKLTSIRNT